MAEAAKVGSIDAIREFREALGTFIEDARNALTSVEMENRRLNEWVKNTQRLFWINEVKRRREKMNEIRGELHRRKLSGAGDTEAKEAVRIAKNRLQVAETEGRDRQEGRAGPPARHRRIPRLARPLGDMLTGELENCMAMLERMAEALDDYIRISSPANS